MIRPIGAVATALLALLGGCHRGADWRETHAVQAEAPADPEYTAPPEATAVHASAQGGVIVSGRAAPGVRVRLASPTGQAIGATADDSGAWSVALPSGDSVRLYGLAEDISGRLVQAEGYVALLPAPGASAVLLRAGTGARAAHAASGALRIAAVDFDSGAGVVSGEAKPNAPVRLTVDGVAGGEARADASGRFAVSVATMLKPGESFLLKPGAHALAVESGGASARARVSVSRPEPVKGGPFRARRVAEGWRIDWITPGGGVQSTLVLDAAEAKG